MEANVEAHSMSELAHVAAYVEAAQPIGTYVFTFQNIRHPLFIDITWKTYTLFRRLQLKSVS